jgi:hypothetical protein
VVRARGLGTLSGDGERGMGTGSGYGEHERWEMCSAQVMRSRPLLKVLSGTLVAVSTGTDLY